MPRLKLAFLATTANRSISLPAIPAALLFDTACIASASEIAPSLKATTFLLIVPKALPLAAPN